MKIRIGIDVGGTFTHAVAIDNDSLAIAAKACRPTTHTAGEGVARGIWECLEALLQTGTFQPEDVVFVAHSTTQATNALLEGDVADVGLIGIGDGASGAQAKRELAFSSVKLQGDKEIKVKTIFIKPDEIEKSAADFARGCGPDFAFAVAEPFGVDDPSREIRAVEIISSLGFPATASHEVSGLYGLKARARTSVVNASILPRMMDVADKTQDAVGKLGLSPTLMIMRSDGGVMTSAGMKSTPILTILSGPAAGVSAAVLYEKIANGLFVEIGGTSTDISMIVNGKPLTKQAVVGGNVLYLKTLDVRTIGVAGGSMIRVSGGKLKDVGPRSAHIAGLEYSCFSDPAEWTVPKVRFISPREGDPGDYAMIDTGGGSSLAVTTTCAANALGMLSENDYSLGNPDAARKAFALIASETGCGADELARRVIDMAAGKIERVCRELMKEYPVEAARLTVVGGGGGASVIAPPAAGKLSLAYRHAKDAEVISAVGVGMALMKTVVEKSIVDPTDSDVAAVRSQAMRELVESGGDPDKIEVEVEVDRQKNIVRASATGATALTADRSLDKIDSARALAIANETLGADSALEIAFDDGSCFVVRGRMEKKGFLGFGKKVSAPAVVVDSFGLAKLTLRNAEIYTTTRENCINALKDAVARGTTYTDGGAAPPPAYMVSGSRITDLSKLADPDKILEIATLELEEHPTADAFCILIAR